MKRCKGVLLAGMLVLSMSVPVYADKSVVVKVEAPADTTDYYMTVDSGGVGVDIYPSTDGKGEKLNDKTVRDGTVLHIEGETEKNGETWGYTEYNGRYGYVPLEELRPSKDAELAKAGIAGSTEKETSAVNQGDASDTQNSAAGETQGKAAGTDNTGSSQLRMAKDRERLQGRTIQATLRLRMAKDRERLQGRPAQMNLRLREVRFRGHLQGRPAQVVLRLRAARSRDRLQRMEQQKVGNLRMKLSLSRSMAQLRHPLKKKIPGIKVRLSGSGSQQYLQ